MTYRRLRTAVPRHALVIAFLAVMSLSSCGGADKDGAEGDNRAEARTRPPSRAATAREHDGGSSGSTPIRIAFGDTELTARLHGSATARDLAAQLPLNLTF